MIEMPFSLMFRSTFHDDADALFADVSSEVHLLMTEMPFFRCIFRSAFPDDTDARCFFRSKFNDDADALLLIFLQKYIS